MDRAVSSPSPDMIIDSESIQERLAWSAIDASDLERIRELAPFADEIADTVIDRFYNHILSFEKAALMFSDEETIGRVKAGQKRYFKELTAANCDENYIRERVRIGQIHERTGIGPDLYIGAYDYH